MKGQSPLPRKICWTKTSLFGMLAGFVSEGSVYEKSDHRSRGVGDGIGSKGAATGQSHGRSHPPLPRTKEIFPE